MTTGLVFDIKKFSIHDGPGIRTTVFFKGCPLTCWWCHNPESQASRPEIMFRGGQCIRCGACLPRCQQGAIAWNPEVLPATDEDRCTLCGQCIEACHTEARQLVGQEMTVAEVMGEIEKDLAFYDELDGGVTFSGGEPLLQPDFLLALLHTCRAKEIHTALDTCGYTSWPRLDSIRQAGDLFLYDLKLMDSTQHRKFTGVSNELILSNLLALAQRGHNIILRLPIIPGVNDDEENIRQTGEFAANTLHLKRVDILPYHYTALDKYDRLNKVCDLPDTRPPSGEQMVQIAQILQNFGLKVNIGG